MYRNGFDDGSFVLTAYSSLSLCLSPSLHLNSQVFPALHKYAAENHDPKSKIVISTTCNREMKLCKHYVPMIQSDKFLMGHPDTEEYLAMQPKEKKYDIEAMIKGVKKLLGFK